MDRMIKPNASDWAAAASGLRSSWPSPSRQGSEAPASRRRRLCRLSRIKPPSTAAVTRPPPSRAKVNCRSRLKRHMIRPRASKAAPYTSQELAGTGSKSRRRTRSGGTRPSAAKGGKAKPARATSPVAMPATAGHRPPGGICAGSRSCRRLKSASWESQPSPAPIRLAVMPSSASCRLNRPSACLRDNPRQRSSALASKRLAAKRAADKATATPASNTAARLARFR